MIEVCTLTSRRRRRVAVRFYYGHQRVNAEKLAYSYISGTWKNGSLLFLFSTDSKHIAIATDDSQQIISHLDDKSDILDTIKFNTLCGKVKTATVRKCDQFVKLKLLRCHLARRYWRIVYMRTAAEATETVVRSLCQVFSI